MAGVAFTLLLVAGMLGHTSSFSIMPGFVNVRIAPRTCVRSMIPVSKSIRRPIVSLRASAADFSSVAPVFVRNSDNSPMQKMPAEWEQPGVYACFDRQGATQFVGMSRKVSASISAHLELVGPETFHSVKAVVWSKPTKEDLEGTAKIVIEECIRNSGAPPPGNTMQVDIWRKKPAEVRRAKENIQFKADTLAENAKDEIKRIVERYGVVLFMKGTRQAPQCGFSDATIALLDQVGVDYECIDCLDADRNPGLRDGIKAFSDWPTIPQLYISGEFVGGAEIIRAMFESGELQPLLKTAKKVFQPATFRSISPEEAHEQLSKNAKLRYIDCRTEAEYTRGHVPGSVNIPAFIDTDGGRVPVRDKFIQNVENAIASKDAQLVIGCQAGIRSKAAAQWLCEEGFTQILEMDGGWGRWNSNPQLPVATSE